jgi:AAA15 family ATPase/GTPase
MQLKEIKFSRFKGQLNEWNIEGRPKNGEFGQPLTLNNMNLIVGKNASGKSRTTDAIRHIADLLSDDDNLSSLDARGYGTAEYQLKFDSNGSSIEYYLNFKEGKIIKEKLIVDTEPKPIFDRSEITKFPFELDMDVSVVPQVWRHKQQHSSFRELYHWGKNLNHYRFGEKLGKNALLKDIKAIKDDEEVDLKDGDEVAEIFIKGQHKFQDDFVKTILSDMKAISYPLKEITTSHIKYFPLPAYGLNVQETDLSDITDQREMSQGMFRALSLLIQLNYSLLSKIPSCILIDDIGEGLDFDRSKSLIDLIIEKVKASSVQVIMTTNDRFVMNKVPLEYWSVIQRVPNKALFYNYQNTESTFKKFKFTGLSNFDFLSSGFFAEDF